MFKKIRKNNEFKLVYENRNSYATKNIVLFVLKKNNNLDMERNRFGISVSKKVGNSVVRHTLVRRMREIFRLNEDKLMENNFIIAVLRVGSDKVDYSVLNKDFLKLCEKHNILKEKV